MNNQIQLTKIVCKNQQEPGNDELNVVVTVDNEKKFHAEHKMNRYSKNTWHLDLQPYSVTNLMTVELYERDPIYDDIIGTASITSKDIEHRINSTVELKGACAIYEISWRYVNVNAEAEAEVIE